MGVVIMGLPPSLQVYRKELEEEGVVVDPLRASYVVDVRKLVGSSPHGWPTC